MTIADRSKPLPDFHDRFPWWGGDLQTLRNQLLRGPEHLGGDTTQVLIPLSDGSDDRLIAYVDTPPRSANEPLVILIHGLTGCSESTYIRASARFHLARGRRVCRLNLRGSGPSRTTCRGYYHAGCARDLIDALEGLAAVVPADRVFIVGYSLGGNILLNLLSELRDDHAIIGGATVSAPIEPLQAAERLMHTRNFFYHRFLLRRMKKDVLHLRAELSEKEAAAVRRSRSVYEFDDVFTAPRNGFDGVEDYYRRTAGAAHARRVGVPLLMVHALNDPWIPAEPYRLLANNPPRFVEPVLVPSGGHVGFHGADCEEAWHDRRIEAFLAPLQHNAIERSL
jgi:uncharacterized protein